MSEEEILKECTELAENEHHELGDCWDEEYSSSAILGLIMLYKQTKKELTNLKEIEQEHQKLNGELRKEIESADHLASVEFIEKNYISKDKIRERLDYYKGLGHTEEQYFYNREIYALEDLL